jgi:peroxiredoxin
VTGEKAKERISVDLLSDFKREVSRRYGTLIEDRFLFEARRRSA